MDQAWSTWRTNYLQTSHHTTSTASTTRRTVWYQHQRVIMINVNKNWSTWRSLILKKTTLHGINYDYQDINGMVSTSMERDSSRWRRPWTTTSWYDLDQPDGQGLIYTSNWSSTTCQLLHTSQLNMYNIIQPNYFWKPVSYLWTKQELTLSQELEY